MKLMVFNPEHDIALASTLANFTAPHAGRQLRADLGFLPALWADEGDKVLVDHVESAEKAFRRVAHRLRQLGCRNLPAVLQFIRPIMMTVLVLSILMQLMRILRLQVF